MAQQPKGYDDLDRHLRATQQILDEKFKAGTLKNLFVPEMLQGISEIPSFGERVEAIRNNRNRSLNSVLHLTFGDFDFGFTAKEVEDIEYEPTYAHDDYSIAPSSFTDPSVCRRLYRLTDPQLNKSRKLLMVADMLENLHPDEAEILKGIFKGSLPYKNITAKLVKTALSSLFPPEEVEKEEKPKKVEEEPKSEEEEEAAVVKPKPKEKKDGDK